MSYTCLFQITIPSEVYETACNVARSLDPDTGGHLSYGTKVKTDVKGKEYLPDFYSTKGRCTFEFKEQIEFLIENPDKLHSLLIQDYKKRWVDLIPPSLPECVEFCNKARVQFPDIESGIN